MISSGYRKTNSNCPSIPSKYWVHDFRQCPNVICNIFTGLVSCFPPYCNQRTERLTRQYHQKWKYTTVSSFVPSEFFNLSEISRINSRAISLLGSSTRTEHKTKRQIKRGNRKVQNTLTFIISCNDEYEFKNLMLFSKSIAFKWKSTTLKHLSWQFEIVYLPFSQFSFASSCFPWMIETRKNAE